MQWGEMVSELSIHRAQEMRLVEGGRHVFSSVGLLVLLLLLSMVTTAAGPEQEKIQFDIPQQRADVSLTLFAEQANLTLILPYETARLVETNELKGSFTVPVAIDLLLAGTDLRPEFNNEGLLTNVTDQSSAVEGKQVDTKKKGLLAVLAAFLVGTGAQAQEETVGEGSKLEEITVTGSRVVRDGYTSPTPVSILNADEFQRSGTPNIADYVNTLPSISGGRTPVTTANQVGQGRQGINSMNLRGIGETRTLTLLDGRRVGGMVNTGQVDISELPQQLVSRVDVVTGGASASYGSDALSGVVNFVLDTKFTGFKAEVSGGTTEYDDNDNFKTAMSWGTPFAGGRGHFLLSGEVAEEDGVFNPSNRPWTDAGWAYINNPDYTSTNGQPRVLLRSQVALSTATLGGAIACSATSSCASLRGIAFGPGGNMYNLVEGPIVSDPIMAGGTMGANNLRNGVNNSLSPSQDRANAFVRVSYDVSDSWTVYGEGMWAELDTATIYYYGGFAQNLTVFADNAYMPASLSTAITDLGLTSVPFGTMKGDNGAAGATAEHGYARYVAGLDGEFDAFGSAWTMNAYFQRARATLTNTATSATHLPNWRRAIDAVLAPNGSVVCRSTLTDPDDGCVPYNLFGEGVNSEAAIDYVTGNPYRSDVYTQNVFSINIAGEPFDNWAGPISVAFGAEHRTEKATGFADEITTESPGNWDTTGGLPTIGDYKTSDIYVETVVPLAMNAAWAESLTISAAARAVDYGDSGIFVPWKLGAEYAPPFEGLRFRAVASRDVREASLSDRYAGVFQSQSSFQNPFNNGINTTARSLASGNPNLDPEVGDTYSAGVVIQPSFLPGFSASIDYYNVEITDAIATQSTQDIVNLCFAGNQNACALFVPTPGEINEYDILRQPLNLASESTDGLDLEASYVFDVTDVLPGVNGTVSIRALATHYMDYEVDPGLPGSVTVQNVGQVFGVPDWRYRMSVNYSTDRLSLTAALRGVSDMVRDNRFIECSSGCPTSTGDNPTYDNVQVPGATYYDFAANYNFGEEGQYELFFNVRNVANEDPSVVARGPTGYGAYTNNPVAGQQFDTLGRTYLAGFRLEF